MAASPSSSRSSSIWIMMAKPARCCRSMAVCRPRSPGTEARNYARSSNTVSPKSYGHGIGVGDLNGDGRNDILTSTGCSAPPDPRTGDWKWHGDWDLGGNVGFIYVLDITGDGRKDLVTSMAHDYGIFLMEQGPGNKAPGPST